MAASSSSGSGGTEDKRTARQKQVMLGELPSDFLRIMPLSAEQQVSVDEQTAIALQQQMGNYVPSGISGRLSMTVAEAKLVKNYGMTRMDPYVRLRLGLNVYETHTDYNGAKNPRWNKVFYCLIFPAAETLISIEIYDECAFSLDEKIAWADYTIPATVFQGEVLDEWIPLSGQQGEGKEGFINLIFRYTPVPPMAYPGQPMVAVMPTPYYGVPAVPYFTAAFPTPYPAQNPAPGQPNVTAQPAAQQRPQPVQISDTDVQQVKEMFPNMEEDVIRTVMESHRGNKDQTINALLALSEGS